MRTMGNGFHWPLRLLMAAMLFGILNFIVNTILQGAFDAADIQGPDAFLQQVAAAIKDDKPLPVLSLNAALRLIGASAFFYFIVSIVSGITNTGLSTLRLRAAANDEATPWFTGLTVGMKDPIGVSMLTIRRALRVIIGLALFVAPGIMLAYSYRQVWFLKARHPDWSSGRCLAESAKMMRGRRWRLFKFDLSYWKAYLAVGGALVLLVLVAFAMSYLNSDPALLKSPKIIAAQSALALAGMSLLLFFTVASVFVSAYYTIGQAIFHSAMAVEDISNSTAGDEKTSVGSETLA